MKAVLLGTNNPAQIRLSQHLVDGLRIRGFQVQHLLMAPPQASRNLLTGVQEETCLKEKPLKTLELNPTVFINLNPDLKAAKLAARYSSCKRFGYFFEANHGRVVVYGKALRYLELQRQSEKYPVFHRVDIFQCLLGEIEELPPQSRPVRAWPETLRLYHSFKRTELSTHRPSPGVEFRELTSFSQLPQASLVATDCPVTSAEASAAGLPVWFFSDFGGELLEDGPYSEGSEVLALPNTSAELQKLLHEKIKAMMTDAGERSTVICRVESGPLVLWPGENLTEAELWDFLFRYSTWSLHLRGSEVSFVASVSRFSAFLLRRDLKAHHRFFLHAHLQNLTSVQEALENLLNQSKGALSEKEVFTLTRRLPFPTSTAAGWFGLKHDSQSPHPTVSLFYQVRLFLTHMKVQRQLLTHCLGVLEGESERVYSE